MDAQPSRLELTTDGERRVVVTGVIDSHTADQLTSELNELGSEADATLDLSAVQFIDSSGLRVVVSAHQEWSEHDAHLRIERPSEAVERLLEITGLRDHLHIV